MSESMEALYAQRLKRYVTAMKNGKPDCIPIRPFAAEFVAKYTGVSCQDVAHDYRKAFDAAIGTMRDFDWDAAVPNMVYVWTGLAEAMGTRYYAVPGIDIGKDVGFQYLEPPEGQEFMKADEYDELIADPTGFLFNVWLPRVTRKVCKPGDPVTMDNNLSFLKGGMAMMEYFNAFGPQIQRMKTETGTVSAIAGILKAPMDILADKLRGYLGLVDDLFERPEKVLAACEALQPHLTKVALATSDPAKQVPVGFWMHRSCTPFINKKHFEQIFWPTLKPIILELWKNGVQTLFYAEGNWKDHLERFAELPAGSIVYHVDQGDIVEVSRVLGEKFCISGGVPNAMLSYGTPDEVRQRCKFLIDNVARDGGYIMDASAIIQNDASIENMKVMTEFTREYGQY